MTTKAVLLAAGRGTRLGAITANYPKALIEVGGRPVIAQILGGLRRAGIEEITIVTGHHAGLVEAELGNGGHEGLRLRYVQQEHLEGTARALVLAREWLGGEQFFFGFGDILVQPENYRRVLTASRIADAVIAINEVDDPWAGAAVYVDDAWRVTRIVEKPERGSSTTPWNNAGFGVLGPAIWEQTDRLRPSARGEYELPEAIAGLVAAGAVVRAVAVEGPWFDIGTPEELEAARAAFGRKERAP